MLCLRRKLNEAIVIGPNIVVTVLQIRGDSVLLGIDAPKDVLLLREELIGCGEKGQCPDIDPPEAEGVK